MTEVTREQFEFTSDASVRHIPTDATFSAYTYPDPKDVVVKCLNAKRAGDRLPNGDEYALDGLLAVATELLRERAETKG